MLRKRELATLRALLAALSAFLLVGVRPAHSQTEAVLYNFSGGNDGANPNSRLTSDGAGNFYGTTAYGGAFGAGTVFELSPDGNGGWIESVLYAFCSEGGQRCTDGDLPYFAYLILDGSGNLYGTTYYGGANGYGAVFELSPGEPSWTETILYSFAGGTDGASPVNGLIRDSAGNLYGATANNDASYGTVFELSPAGGGWTKNTIYTEDPNSPRTWAGLVMDSTGNIFGVTSTTIFELSPSGSGGWNSDVIYTFPGYPRDGTNPQGTLALDQAGNLYGTTTAGGADNVGTVYKLTRGKKGWTEKRLYSFKGASRDGNTPYAGIVFDASGNIYGTTTVGGAKLEHGTVFELVAPVGRGGYKERVLWNFNGTDGAGPFGGLILDNGSLYGTTLGGGTGGSGVVFAVAP